MRRLLLEQGPLLRRRFLLATVFGVPVLFLRMLSDPINVPKLSLLIAAVSVVAAVRLAEIAQGAPWDGLKRLLVPAAAMGLPLVLAWAASPYRGWSLMGNYPRFGGLLPYLVAIALGVLLADAFPGRASEIAWALVAAGSVAGFYALVQFAGLDPFEWNIKGGRSDQASSTLGNSNFTGGFLAIVLPVAVALAYLERRRRRTLATAAVLLILGGLLSSVSQGAWLAALAGAVVLGGCFLSTRSPALRIASFIVAGLLALVAVGTVSATLFIDDPPVPDTANRRGQWWAAAAAMGADSPLLGRGPNAFAVEHAQFRTALDAATVTSDITTDPHSVPLSFWSGAGVLGLAGFLGAVGWVLGRGNSVSREDLLAAGFFSAVVAYLVQSLVSIDTVALRTSFWIVVAGTSAVLTAASQDGVPGKKSAKRGGRDQAAAPLKVPLLIGAAALAVLGLWGASTMLLADRSFFQGQRAFAAGDLNGAIERFDAALARRDDHFYRQAYGRDLGRVAVALAEQDQDEPAQQLLDRTRELFSYVDSFPHVGSIVDYAQVLRAWSEARGQGAEEVAAEAMDLYLRAVQLDPKNEVVVVEAMEHARSREDWASLAGVLRPAARYLDDPNGWGTLALAEAHLGQEEEARAALDRALELDAQQGSALEAQVILRAE